MKLKVQLVVCADDGGEEQVQEVATFEKDCQRIEHLGLTLSEAKQLLKTLQYHILEQQTTAFVAAHAQCDHCGDPLRVKGQHTRTFRTLFGTVALTSPRLYHCRCQRRKTTTFRPLNLLLTEPTAPELLFMETKWASLMSYGLTAQALKDFLPVDATLNATTIQNHTLAVAQRCEDELGEEQWAFVEGCPATWETLPIPDGPLTVGIDGGYVRNWEAKKQQFEVIVGKSILAFRREDEEDVPSSKCFGFVQTLDTKPKRRLFEVLQSQGHQMNQQITFLSDGGDTVRDLQLYMNPQAEHLLDWFHLAMRLTVMQQSAKGLPQTIRDDEATYALRDPVVHQLERLKWSLWHGNVYKAFHKIAALAMDRDVAVATTGDATARKLLKAVEEFHTYIERNRTFIPNYGERYRCGERISTGFVESTVNQVISRRFCKKQQMQWTKRGAHLLLQTRVKVLNQELGAVFQRWYPALQLEEEFLEEAPLAA
ncbi:MAG TPA: ISKra4 family transposase [Candidatus Saccharimonadia bacterium]|nr:ISKra4 family transposase [Candidatus Saccharimonadia bacterium]